MSSPPSAAHSVFVQTLTRCSPHGVRFYIVENVATAETSAVVGSSTSAQ
jgi:hypothetical protein